MDQPSGLHFYTNYKLFKIQSQTSILRHLGRRGRLVDFIVPDIFYRLYIEKFVTFYPLLRNTRDSLPFVLLRLVTSSNVDPPRMFKIMSFLFTFLSGLQSDLAPPSLVVYSFSSIDFKTCLFFCPPSTLPLSLSLSLSLGLQTFPQGNSYNPTYN